MKVFSSLTLILIILFFSKTFGNIYPLTHVPSSMQKEINQLLHFPKTRQFITSLQSEGPINLNWIPMGDRNFHAFWSSKKRLVALNSSRQWNPGEKIFSILFELHNAKANKELSHLDQLASKNKISKNKYVEAVERIEYMNMLKTARLLEEGVHLGYFPKETYIPENPTFREHFKIQKECGHSAFIAKKYDDLKFFQ